MLACKLLSPSQASTSSYQRLSMWSRTSSEDSAFEAARLFQRADDVVVHLSLERLPPVVASANATQTSSALQGRSYF